MSDLISRQAAIDAILSIKDYGNSDRANALGLAEFAITTLPSAQPVARDINVLSNDLISRQAAIDAVFGKGHGTIKGRLEALPSAQPEIIQCVDCRSRDKDGWCTGRGWPMQLVPADGFCDKGIRKEDVE